MCYVHTQPVNSANGLSNHGCLLRDSYDAVCTPAPTPAPPATTCGLDSGAEAWPAGYCLNNGGDQNAGVVKLDGGDYEGAAKEAECLAKCKDYSVDGNHWTGCETIFNQGNRGCYVHTQPMNSANGLSNHGCLLRDSYDAVCTPAPT